MILIATNVKNVNEEFKKIKNAKKKMSKTILKLFCK